MKYIKILLTIIITIVLLVGCGNEEENTTEPTDTNTTSNRVDKDFYGNWKNLDTGEVEKIDKNYTYPITSLGSNFIKVTKEDKEFMLLRYGSNNGTVKGRLYSDITSLQKSSQKISKKLNSSKKFIVTIDDGSQKQTQEVLGNEEFSFSGVHSGGSVRVTIKSKIGDIEDTLPPESNNTNEPIIDENFTTPNINTDLGNFPVPAEESSENDNKENSYNLKLVKTDIQDEDDRYMYSEGTYSGVLTYKNFNKKEAIGLNYTLTTDNNYVDDLEVEVQTGTVLPDQSVDIPFTITFKMLDKIKHTVKLDFLVRDANGKDVMLDNVYLDFYQTSIWVNIKAKTSNIKGYFVTPEHEVVDIDSNNMKVRLPKRPNDKYYFVVTQPTDISEETIYSLGVDVNASEFGNFHDTSIYEPNNSENSATKLHINDSIKSYIHKGDIDFYTIDFQSNLSFVNPPNLPFD